MAEQAPLWLDGVCYEAADDRRLMTALVDREGVSNPLAGDLLVASTGTTDHSVTIATGDAFIQGDDVPTTQGMYEVANVGAVTLQLTAGGGGNNRFDTIIARVYDSQYAGGSDTWALEVLAGTPSASVGATGTAFTPAGIAASVTALPNNAIALAYVRVITTDTTSSTIAAGDILDVRKAYQSASGTKTIRVYRNAAFNVTAAGGVVQFDSVSYNTWGGELGATVGASGTLFDTSTGIFTAPTVGLYRVSWNLGATMTATGQFVGAQIQVNSSSQSTGFVHSSLAAQLNYTGSVVVTVLTAGHTIKLFQQASGTLAGVTGVAGTFMSIEKIAA